MISPNAVTDPVRVASPRPPTCEVLQRRWHARVFRFALLCLGDEKLAHKCTHEVLTRLQPTLLSGSNSEQTVQVFQTAQRFAQDVLDANASSQQMDPPTNSLTATRSGSFLSREGLAAVCWALAQLPKYERIVVVLRHFERIVFDDIARILTLSNRSVKLHFRHGLLHLHDVLVRSGLAPQIHDQKP